MAFRGSFDYSQPSFGDPATRIAQEDFLDQRKRAQQMEEMGIARANAAQDRAFAEDQRRFNLMQPEGGRQFDQRMNVLRSLFSGAQAPYAAMPNGPAQQSSPIQYGAMRVGGQGHGPQYNDPMRPKVNNYLAQLLGGNNGY